MIAIVDTDALLGLFFQEDPHTEEVKALAEKLAEREVEYWVLTTTLGEFALLASSKIGVVQTKEALKQLREMSYGVVGVDDELMNEACELYYKQTSKEESLFDCCVMAAAKKVGADCIFSFDKGYKKNGFKLAEDMV